MGGLYPPLGNPFFAKYSDFQARVIKEAVTVEMDHQEVLDARMNSYDAPPWSVEYGRNDITLTPFAAQFSGTILSSKRLPTPAPPLPKQNDGLWRIECVFPFELPDKSFPCLQESKGPAPWFF